MNSVNPIPLSNSTQDVDFSRIGDALMAHTKLKHEDVERILAVQKEKNILFGEAAKYLGLISEGDLKKALSEQFEYPYIHDNNSQISKSLIAADSPFSQEVESMRSLRGQLLIRWFNAGNKTLALTSVSGEDGASQLIANLAILFSQLNKNTLLIDANLRQPKQHELFGVETKLGLTNILSNRKGRYELSRQKTFPNLTILSAGTLAPNPQELLNRHGFGELLADLENIYDVILIDTAPSSLGQDYLAVVSNSKAAFIVARKNHTLIDDLIELKTHLEMTGVEIVGSVLQEL